MLGSEAWSNSATRFTIVGQEAADDVIQLFLFRSGRLRPSRWLAFPGGTGQECDEFPLNPLSSSHNVERRARWKEEKNVVRRP